MAKKKENNWLTTYPLCQSSPLLFALHNRKSVAVQEFWSSAECSWDIQFCRHLKDVEIMELTSLLHQPLIQQGYYHMEIGTTWTFQYLLPHQRHPTNSNNTGLILPIQCYLEGSLPPRRLSSSSGNLASMLSIHRTSFKDVCLLHEYLPTLGHFMQATW